MFLEHLQNLEKESLAISELGRLVNEVKACSAAPTLKNLPQLLQNMSWRMPREVFAQR